MLLTPVDVNDTAAYGDAWASIYDEVHAHDPADAVEILAELAGTGNALELGVGTGRIAIPLTARGVAVHGIEASQAMLDRMRAKPGGASIPVTLGDFTDVPVAGEYTLVYVVASTLYGVLTQAAQVACVRNAAERLTPGGVFVFEGFVPDIARVSKCAHHDPVQQRISSERVVADRTFPVEIRYVWPTELDLMAQLAGLRLRERWGNWRRGAYTGIGAHVSIYERASRCQ